MKKINVIVVACLMAMSYVSANAQNEQPQTQVDAFCGQIVEITATPNSGYRFVRWSDEDDSAPSVGATRQIEVDANFNPIGMTFTAIFEADTYTVTASANEEDWGGVTIEGGAQGDFGTQKTLVAVPSSACYRFVRWEDDPNGTSYGATRVVEIKADNNNYVAIFEQVTFQVNVASENTTMGTVSISRL